MKQDTLIILKAHIVNDLVLNEYKKMVHSGYDILLLCDNRLTVFPDTGQKYGWLKWKGVKINYYLTIPSDYEALALPKYTYNHNEDKFSALIWYNSDYPFYLIRRIFPEYGFYWQFDYDCYLNARDYSEFFNRFDRNYDDLLIQHLRRTTDDDKWMWSTGVEWAYKGCEMWGGLYPIVRLSGEAIDYLYQKRLEKGKIFENTDKNQVGLKWLNTEVFTPTELAQANFTMSPLRLDHVVFRSKLTTEDHIKIFSSYNNKIYHPVKDNNVYTVLFSSSHSDKYTLEHLYKELKIMRPSIPDPIISLKYRFVQFPVMGIRDIHFEFYIISNYIYSALHFENKYASLHTEPCIKIKEKLDPEASIIDLSGRYRGIGIRYWNYILFYNEEILAMVKQMNHLMETAIPILEALIDCPPKFSSTS